MSESSPGKSFDRSGPGYSLPNFAYSYKILEEIPLAVYICNRQGKITFYNSAALHLWGRTPDLDSEYWSGAYREFDIEGSEITVAQHQKWSSFEDNRAFRALEMEIERPSGVKKNVLLHIKPIYSTLGKVKETLHILADISDKEQKEQELRQSENSYRLFSEVLEQLVEERTHSLKLSEERYHKMVDEVKDYAIIMLDVEGRVVNWNKGAEDIKGYTEKEIIGENFKKFYTREDIEHGLPNKLLEKAKKEGRSTDEGWRVKKDGSTFWGSVVITALHNDENEIIGFTKVSRDLTERKLAQDQMQKYAVDIELRNKQLEEFAFVASHDLQEPLRKIRMFSDLLEKDIQDEERARRSLKKIQKSATRMTNLIKDVLEYSQLSQTADFVPVNLEETLDQVKDDLEVLIEEKNATIEHSELPEIAAIPIQMHQLFSNLIGNSLKFCDEQPHIKIECTLLNSKCSDKFPDTFHKTDYWEIDISDNGPGFDPQYQDKVFELFKRLDKEQEGTGIGLSLCKKIVDNHFGTIEVDSQPGEGATFKICLPLNAEALRDD
ncbi:PAS domain S-box protein [Halocola ammonii]